MGAIGGCQRSLGKLPKEWRFHMATYNRLLSAALAGLATASILISIESLTYTYAHDSAGYVMRTRMLTPPSGAWLRSSTVTIPSLPINTTVLQRVP